MTHARRLQVPCKNRDPVDRGIAADTVRLEIEVHRLRDMYTCYTLGGKVHDDAARIIPAADNKPVYPKLLQTFFYALIFPRVRYLADLDP